MSHRLDGWPGVDVQSFGALLFVPGTTRPKYGGEGYEIAADNVAALADGGDPDGSAALASSASTRSTPTGGSGSGPGCGRSVASIGQSFGAGSACPADPAHRSRPARRQAAQRLDGLFAIDEPVEVEATWGIYQRMIAT